MERKIEIATTRFSKRLIALFVVAMFTQHGWTQNAGISASAGQAPNPAAGLDVNFSTKGLLIPRVSLTATANAAPLAAHVAGMVVYNTATVADVTPGFYVNNGTKWVPGLPKATANGDLQYWDGTTWKTLPIGQPGQKLQISSAGVPAWVP